MTVKIGDKVKFKESVTLEQLEKITGEFLDYVPECFYTVKDIDVMTMRILLEEDFGGYYFPIKFFVPYNEEYEIIKLVKKHCKEECIMECCSICSLYPIGITTRIKIKELGD